MKKTALRWTSRALLGLSLTLLMACGTTLEKQQDRFKRNQDTIEALLAKHPKMKDAVAEKLKGFQVEKEKIVQAGGEDAKTKLAQLNSRMEEYVAKLDPSLAKPASTASAAPGSKLAPGSAAPMSAAVASKAAMGSPLTAAPMSAAAMSAAPMSAAPMSAAPMSAAPMSAAPMSAAPMSAALGGKLGAPATAAPASAAPATAAPALGGKLGGAASQPVAPPAAGSQPAR